MTYPIAPIADYPDDLVEPDAPCPVCDGSGWMRVDCPVEFCDARHVLPCCGCDREATDGAD